MIDFEDFVGKKSMNASGIKDIDYLDEGTKRFLEAKRALHGCKPIFSGWIQYNPIIARTILMALRKNPYWIFFLSRENRFFLELAIEYMYDIGCPYIIKPYKKV